MSLAMLEVQVPKLLSPAFQRAPHGPAELGEDRVVLGGVSWEQYAEIEQERGPESSCPRLYYLDDQLEIMTVSRRHERLSKWLGDMLSDFLFHGEVEVFTCGKAMLQRVNEAGAEPSDSWCLGEDKETPDIVLEIALTSGGLDKLEVYRQFAVREVWLWRRDTLEIWELRAEGGGYDGPGRASGLLAALDIALLERCLALPTWREARRAFRAGMATPDAAP